MNSKSTSIISQLLRPHLKQVVPYSSARDEFTATDEILLDANENSLGAALKDPELQYLSRYPDPQSTQLKTEIAALDNLSAENIFIGNGSDEAIDLLIRAFLEPAKDKILICPPTYGMYKVAARINNIEVLSVPLNSDFSLNLQACIQCSKQNAPKLAFFCSPNNPTGNLLSSNEIKSFAKDFHGIVVVDEAYIDFANKADSPISSIKNCNNIVILRTLSKSWGLAGLRVGYAIGSSELVQVLNNIKPPYNIDAHAQKTAIKALRSKDIFQSNLAELDAQKTHLVNELESCKEVVKVFPSDANFLLVRFNYAKSALEKLLSAGIVVRDRSNELGCKECLRISVGSAKENSQLIKTLKG